MTTTAHEDQYAPEPVNDNGMSQSHLGGKCGHPACELYGRCMTGDCQRAARDTKADSDGDDGA